MRSFSKRFLERTKSYLQISRNKDFLFILQELILKSFFSEILRKIFTCSIEKKLFVSSLVLFLNSNGFFRAAYTSYRIFLLLFVDDLQSCVSVCSHSWKRFYTQRFYFPLIALPFNFKTQLFTYILQNSCSLKFCSIHKKTVVLESLQHRFFSVNIARFLRTGFFYRVPSVAASIP